VSASDPTSDASGENDEGVPIRVVLAKLGLDGHDRGLKVVARTLRDGGCEVVYLGLRQTAESVAAAAEQEDADVIGISMHNGGHLTLAPNLVKVVRAHGLDTAVVVGGIVPDVDLPKLLDAGVAAVLGPGASADEVVAAVRSAAARS
jgi:methylmalonyl-CoA mutase C-terminal domain/subunit